MTIKPTTAYDVNQDALDFMARGPKLLLIDNQWVPATSGHTFDALNPATEEVLAAVAEAGPADVDRAVAAARRAYEHPSWAGLAPTARERYLHRIADLIEAHTEELATLDTLNNGMPLVISRLSMQAAAAAFRYFAGWPTKVFGNTNPTDGTTFSYTLREPLGVVGAIIPWNGPLQFAAWKIAPALAFGNTVVIKPSELTPLSILRLGELLLEAGLPAGVVNIVPGFGAGAGQAMSDHPGIDKIAFTGSTPVGQGILRASAKNMKKVTLELGGKSPVLIFPDADLDRAVATALIGFTGNSGQACMAGTRILIHESIYEDVAAKIVAAAGQLKVGNGLDPATQMGPITNQKQFEKVLSYFELGQAEGATLATGGARVGSTGYFVQPTVFTHVRNDMRLAQEEIFGPVAALIPFTDEADAIRQANATPFGLAACVWTADLNRAYRVARAIQAGMVWVNTVYELEAITPFGGYKQSGLGRELGEEAVGSYTQVKSVVVRY